MPEAAIKAAKSQVVAPAAMRARFDAPEVIPLVPRGDVLVVISASTKETG
jgi:hypothetical protein